MREDMAKVIVERPRYGSRLPSRKKGYRKYVQSSVLEDLPAREPLPGRWKGRQRCLNEHLGPMRRFLRSRLGRPWNKVHQELCEHVAFENAVQKHVLTHVFDFVEQHVELRGRDVIAAAGWRRGRALPRGQLYVCPRSGLLKEVRRRPPRARRVRIQAAPQVQYHCRDGRWWELRLVRRPDDPAEQWDVWLERSIAALSVATCLAAYGGKLFANSKRPLSAREARRVLRAL